MGSNIPGSKEIEYRTKNGITISYIFYDLKGKGRYPPEPDDISQVNNMFQVILSNIQANIDSINYLKQFNKKYRFRFILMHQRKIKEYFMREHCRNLSSRIMEENGEHDIIIGRKKSKEKKSQLQQKLQEIQQTKSSIKMSINELSRMISQQKFHQQFIEIKGMNRIFDVLEKQITTNNSRCKTNFLNQIDLLRFIKSYQWNYPKQFYKNVEKRKDYGFIILSCFHPICTPVTAYCLTLLQDYIKHSSTSKPILTLLRQYSNKHNEQNILKTLTQTLLISNNILMIYYILKFMNGIFSKTMNKKDSQLLKQQILNIKYNQIIQIIKNRLQSSFYILENCIFINVSKQISIYANKGQQQFKNYVNNNSVTSESRNIKKQKNAQVYLQQTFHQSPLNAKRSIHKDDQPTLTVYLSESQNKQFNKLILNILNKIRIYNKLQQDIQSICNCQNDQQIKQQKYILNKIQNNKLEHYLKDIQCNCIKSNCSQIMFNVLKYLQMFQKNQWKVLNGFVNQQININLKFKENQIELVKKKIKEKEEIIQKQTVENELLKKKIAIKEENKGCLTNSRRKNSSDLPKQPIISNKILPRLPEKTLDQTNCNPQKCIQNAKAESFQKLQQPSNNHSPSTSLESIPVNPPPPPPLNSSQTTLVTLPPPPPPSFITSFQTTSVNLLPPPPLLTTSQTTPENLLPPFLLLPPPPPQFIGALPAISVSPPSNNLSINNNGQDFPAPPPPPPLIPTLPKNAVPQYKKKSTKQSNIPLKACNYNILSIDKIKSTIWQKLSEDNLVIDYQQLQKYFYKQIKQQKQTIYDIRKNGQKEQKKQVIKLLQLQRWRNIQIILTKLKIPQGQIISNLLTCTGKYCNIQSLESILKILPMEGEETVVKMYSGNVNELGKPELFFKELFTVPEYGSRIKSIMFQLVKDNIYLQTQRKIQLLTVCFNSLTNNYRFHYILEVSLAIGNYLNGNSLKGGAWGFKVDDLQKLQEVKSYDGKMNAGFYLVKEVWKKFQSPLFQKEQLDMYVFLTKLSVSDLSADVGELRLNLEAIRKAEKSQIKGNDSDCIGKFCKQMREELQTKVQILSQMMKNLNIAYMECAKCYCEDSMKYKSEDFGKKIYKCLEFINETQKNYKIIQEKIENQKLDNQKIKKITKFQIKNCQKQSKTSEIPPLNTYNKDNQINYNGEKLREYEMLSQKNLQSTLKKKKTNVMVDQKNKTINRFIH